MNETIMKYDNGDCYAEIGSVTQAMRARSILANAAIPCEITKGESRTKKGCVYSLSFSCSQANNVRTVLANARIPIKHLNIN